jgi:hypothetical protein
LLSEPREPTLPTSSNDEAEAVCESPWPSDDEDEDEDDEG